VKKTIKVKKTPGFLRQYIRRKPVEKVTDQTTRKFSKNERNQKFSKNAESFSRFAISHYKITLKLAKTADIHQMLDNTMTHLEFSYKNLHVMKKLRRCTLCDSRFNRWYCKHMKTPSIHSGCLIERILIILRYRSFEGGLMFQ